MSSTPKAVSTTHTTPIRGTYRVAIVGAGTVKGKEVVDVLTDRNFPSADIKLLDDEEAIGKLENSGDEMTFIQSLREEQFTKVDFTFFASDADATQNYWKAARDAGSTIIDLSGALEGEPDAVVRSPWIERQRGQSLAPQLQPGPAVIAHPASVVLALLLLRLQKAVKLSRVAATIFEPASERGQKGMDELHEQTVNLLSFQPLPKNIFDTQVAFNMVSQYGEQAKSSLARIEARIASDYKVMAGDDAPMPALLTVQAPIFHGYAFAVYIETQISSDVASIAKALAGEHVTLSTDLDAAPSNVNAAGHGDILVSVAADRNHPGGFWLWAAADNLRVAATNAVECAETMAASRPHGQIQ